MVASLSLYISLSIYIYILQDPTLQVSDMVAEMQTSESQVMTCEVRCWFIFDDRWVLGCTCR